MIHIQTIVLIISFARNLEKGEPAVMQGHKVADPLKALRGQLDCQDG